MKATIAQSNESNQECDSMELILHNGPSFNHVTVLVNRNKANSYVTGKLRRKVIEVSYRVWLIIVDHMDF